MSDRERLRLIDRIMCDVRGRVKNYVREGFSTDLRERISLDELKMIGKLAKGTRK